MNAYEPRPGTTAFRALAHLDTINGGELSTGALGEAIGVATSNLLPCLDSAISAGTIFRRRKDKHPKAPWFWSRVDHDGSVLGSMKAAAKREEHTEGVRSTASHSPQAIARDASARGHGMAGTRAVDPATRAEPPSPAMVVREGGEAREFACGLFSDGRFVIELGGQSITLAREDTEQLIRFIERLAPEVPA